MRRDWTRARARWQGHGCLICAHPGVDLAHTIGRKHDADRGRRGSVISVDPRAVVPLCSLYKGGNGHHEEYDAHRLNLMQHLGPYPDVVAWARDRIGAGQADRYLLGPDWSDPE